MAERSAGYATRRNAFIVLGALVLLGLIVSLFFLDTIIQPVAEKKIIKTVAKKSGGLYRLKAGNLDFSFWNRSITFSDLHISVDTTEYLRLRNEKRLPLTTFEVFIPSGVLQDIDLSSLFFAKKIDIGQLHTQQARVRVFQHNRNTVQNGDDDDPLWKQIQPGIRSIRLALATCKDLYISHHDVDNPKGNNWKLEHCNARFTDILVDSASRKDADRLMFAKDVVVTARNLNLRTRDRMYNLQAGSATFSSRNRNAVIREFSMQPAINEEMLIKQVGHQHEIYKLNIPAINVRDLQWNEWLANDILKINTIELKSPVIKIHMDRNAKPNPYSKKGQYPQQLLQKLPFGIDVRKLTAMNGIVLYTEKNNRNQLTGNLKFSNVRGAITNITNTSGGMNRNASCIADIHSTLLDKGQLHTVFHFKLPDKSGAFNVNATISGLDANQLQPLTKAMAMVDIQTFNMKKLNYSISGNENAATGNLRMMYDDLDILIYQVAPDGKMNDKGLLSFFANRFAVYKDNPMDGKTERKAERKSVERDVTKSFFALIWKTLSASASEIMLRPRGQRMIERNQERVRQQSVVAVGDNK